MMVMLNKTLAQIEAANRPKAIKKPTKPVNESPKRTKFGGQRSSRQLPYLS